MNQSHFYTLVSDNKVQVDPLWKQECKAYNIQFILPDTIKEMFSEIQQEIAPLEKSLLTCPSQSLHISLASILGVRADYFKSKDEIWGDISSDCLKALSDIAGNFPSFDIVFKKVIATDSAVLVLAEDNGSTSQLRDYIKKGLPMPSETINTANIIHTTLFRYSGKLLNPERFLKYLMNLKIDITVQIDHLSVERELQYPSICSETIEQFGLNGYK